MKKIPYNVFENAAYLLEQLPKGALVSTVDGDSYNTMTIGWGAIGIDWSLPVFTIYVRESRYTHQLLDKSGCFTVNYPLPGQNAAPILRYCGQKSGRDVDKFKECNLTAVPGTKVNAPGIVELPITIECEILYAQDQEGQKLPQFILDKNYPQGDFHTVYYGRIVDAYILEKD